MACRVSRRGFSLKRLLPVLLVVLVGAVVGVSDAPAGGIADDTCPNVAGENTNTCPPGTEGVPYAIAFKESEGSGCGPGKQTFHLDSGALPPGLNLELGGTLHGTPTQAGTYRFYVEMREPEDDPANCAGERTQKQFTLVINPGVPRLIIGPESAGPGTVGVLYSLPMTATVPDPKTWSIVAGALPPGLTLGATDGVISGTPQAQGSFTFTVLAAIDSARSDTKTLTIEVRAPLVIAPSTPFDATRTVTRWEVGVPFDAALTATGGTGTYTWALVGALPVGMTLGPDGTVLGTPRAAGTFRFAVTVADTEGRTASYAARLVVAPRLAVLPRPLRPGKVGRPFRAKLLATGGVVPKTWRVVRGPLPRGVRFDRLLGLLTGSPKKAGRYRVVFEVTDALEVTSRRAFLIRVFPSADA